MDSPSLLLLCPVPPFSRRLSIPLNGFLRYGWLELTGDFYTSFNSIEWILFKDFYLKAVYVPAVLSIPLNGFTFTIMPMAGPRSVLSIPLNGFNIRAGSPAALAGAAFNSIEWIQYCPLGYLDFEILPAVFQFHWMDSQFGGRVPHDASNGGLSIPLNGFLFTDLIGKVKSGFDFQFHWMDSVWVGSIRPCSPWTSTFNSIEWIPSDHLRVGKPAWQAAFNSIEWIPIEGYHQGYHRGVFKPFNSIEWIPCPG